MPGFLPGEDFFRVVISPAAGDHRDFVPAPGQVQGEIRQVLPAGNHIGIKSLIEKKNFHEALELLVYPPEVLLFFPPNLQLDRARNRLPAHQHQITAPAGSG